MSYFIKLLKKKWYILAIASFLAAVLTFLLLTIKPKEYYSRAQISAGITDNHQVSFEKSELSWSDVSNKFTNFLEFLNSKEIFYMVGYRMLLLDIESQGAYKSVEFAELTKKYSKEEIENAKVRIEDKYRSMQPLDLENKNDLLIYEMLKTMYHDPVSMSKVMQVSRITGSDYIKVEVKSNNPKLSSQLVNIYCEEAIRIHNDKEIKTAEKSVAFFKQLLLTKKLDFEKKLDSLTALKSGNQVVDFATQSETQIEKIAALEKSRHDEDQKITGLRRAISNIDNQLSASAKESYGNNHSNKAILLLKNKIEQLNNRNINSGFKNKAIADSISLLQNELERQIDMLSDNLYGDNKNVYKDLLAKKMDYEIELSMAEASIKTLDQYINTNRSSLTQFVGNEAALTPLEMSVNVAKDEYTRVVDKYNDAINEAMKNGALVRQIEIGQPSSEPEPTKRVLFSAIAAVASLTLGLSVLFLMAYFDNTIKDPENFVKNTGLNLLGFVCKIPSRSENVDRFFFDTKGAITNDIKYKEQLRSIRYEIEQSQDRTLLFTSTGEGDGKSFVIISLAYSMILNYKKILIIDTNFKNNTLSAIFNSNKSNFQDYFYQPERKLLSDTNTVYTIDMPHISSDPSVDNIVQKTRIEGLDIISCQSNDLSPSEIFHGKRFHELLDTLRHRYDYIFMEGSCLNLYSDTKELSEYCDKVIGVFGADKAISQIDKESIKYLKSMGNKYLGSILNKVEMDYLTI